MPAVTMIAVRPGRMEIKIILNERNKISITSAIKMIASITLSLRLITR